MYRSISLCRRPEVLKLVKFPIKQMIIESQLDFPVSYMIPRVSTEWILGNAVSSRWYVPDKCC